jgi:hypothetical protein
VDDASPPWNDGNDEIYIDHIKADGDVIVPLTWVGDIANSAPESLESIIPQPVHFFSDIKVEIFDDDGFANGDDDYATNHIYAAYLSPFEPGPSRAHSSSVRSATAATAATTSSTTT